MQFKCLLLLLLCITAVKQTSVHTIIKVTRPACCCVIIVIIMYYSSEADFCAHYNKGDQAGMLLCYFTKRREAGLDRISPDSREHLYLRVDPNSREVKRVTVEALLYTPPSKSLYV